jgi:hypothetical protein
MQQQFQHFFAVIENEWPKALIGSVIPISQYAWKLWNDRQIEARKKVLRERISDLAQFLQVPLPDAPDAAKVRRDAETEYSDAVAKLAELCGHEKKTVAAIQSDVIQESSGPAVRPAAAPSPLTNQAPPVNVRVSTSYSAAAAGPPNRDVLAKHAAVPSRSARNRFRSWFLLYIPKKPLAWIPQTLFFAFLSFTFFGAIGILSDSTDPDFWSGILGILVLVGIALLFRMWAVRANAERGEHRGLSKKPRRWVPIVVTVVGIIYEFSLFVVFSTDDDDNFSSAVMRENRIAILVTTLVITAIVFAFWYRWRRLTLRQAVPDSLEAKTSPQP